MKVTIKKSEDEIRRELFGPIQQAARTPYNAGITVEDEWCDLSEARLFSLIVEYKPAGVSGSVHKAIIVDRLAKVYDDEPSVCEMFLAENHITGFREQQKLIREGKATKRMTFPPKYEIRPTLAQLDAKLNTHFNMKIVDSHEGLPDGFEVVQDFFLPEGEYSQLINSKEESSPPQPPSTTSSAPPPKKRRIATPDI